MTRTIEVMNPFIPRAVGAITLLAASYAAANATTLPLEPSGICASVDPATGLYIVTSAKPPWRFAGTIDHPLTEVKTSLGRDKVDAFDEVSFDWTQGSPMTGSIRLCRSRPIVVFSWTTGQASQGSPIRFPSFSAFPKGLSVLSYKDSNFSPRSFGAEKGSTPWMLFDGNGNAAVVSPAANFMVANMSGDAQSNITCAIDPRVTSLPKGFTHNTILVFGQGINATWDAWGKGLTDYLGVKRTGYDADTFLKDLGYWTDNGAAYYYNYDKTLGYEGTLLAVRDELKRLGIPIRYIQLDSWWYQKTTVNYKGEDEKEPKVSALPEGTWNAYGGLTKYEAHPFVFPDGLGGFKKKVGLPLATHNRWIDVDSPYRRKYKIPGLQATDPKYWDEIIGYIARSGVKMYEQDWLNYTWEYSPRFQTEPYTAAEFLDGMAGACAKYGLSIQYCMTLPRYLLQGSRYPNLTNVRVSDDRFDRGKWESFLYTSRLSSALGEWPWVDTFMSKERDNMLLATLSAGPVGFGDLMGQESVENALMAARPDGVLVKPDASIVPVDTSVISDALKEHNPLVASTFTQHGLRRTSYVFAFARKGDGKDLSIDPAGVGLDGPGYAYFPFSGESQQLNSGDTIRRTLTDKDSAYIILAPIGISGIAFMGDAGKFVGAGKQRIAAIAEKSGVLTVTVLFAPGEGELTLHGFAGHVPHCNAGKVAWDANTGHFTVPVASNGKVRETVTISE